jgi:hypothetical protein
MPLAGTPPAAVKRPPAYRAGPVPSSKTVRAETTVGTKVPLFVTPLPRADQEHDPWADADGSAARRNNVAIRNTFASLMAPL